MTVNMCTNPVVWSALFYNTVAIDHPVVTDSVPSKAKVHSMYVAGGYWFIVGCV